MSRRIAIIGTGLIGQAWSISFSVAGFNVVLWDSDANAADKALSSIRANVEQLGVEGLIQESVDAICARISIALSLLDALDGAQHVQENTTEDLTIKKGLLATLDEMLAASATIASSTSALLPSDLFEGLSGASRCLVAHPINPPYLIRAVELVPGPKTNAETMDRCKALLTDAGHEVVVLDKEIDGFVVNRLQGALLDEAFRLVEAGIADAEDIDIAIRDGLANRWAIMGPFETIDLNAPGGVSDYVIRYAGMYDRLAIGSEGRADWTGPVLDVIERDRRKRLPLDKLPERSRWRDKQLMKLRTHKRKAGLEN